MTVFLRNTATVKVIGSGEGQSRLPVDVGDGITVENVIIPTGWIRTWLKVGG